MTWRRRLARLERSRAPLPPILCPALVAALELLAARKASGDGTAQAEIERLAGAMR